MDLIDRLKAAAEGGEILTVLYHGGSQPGAKRLLSPIVVAPQEVKARDLATGTVKNFLISKIEVVAEDFPAKEYVVSVVLSTKYRTLRESLEEKFSELESLGWYVQVSESSVTVHRCFKNGKPKKGPDAGILKHNDVHNRHWYVFGPDLASARTFSHLDKAVNLFLAQAYSHAPVKVPSG